MSKFNPNDRVIVIDEDENVTKGEIQTDYESLGIAIVKLDDGSIKKVNYRNVYRDPEPTAKADENVADEPDEEKKLPEGAKVITFDMFLKALTWVSSPESLGKKEDELNDNAKRNLSFIFMMGLVVITKILGDKSEIEIDDRGLLELLTKTIFNEVNGDPKATLLIGIGMAEMVKYLFDNESEK